MTQKLPWILATLRLNWRNAIADKSAFWSLTLLMAVQNLIYFGLWVIIFSRLSTLRGWGLSDVAFLYGAGAIGYGMAFALFGGLYQLSSAIQEGLLDVYLVRPQPVLLSLMIHRLRADPLGDILSGLLMVGLFVKPSLIQVPLLFLLCILAGSVYAAMRVIAHTLAFWGTGNDAGENGFIAFLIASTNPPNGFGFWGKFFLLTLFPAGYISLLPVEILHRFDLKLLMLEIVGSCGVVLFAIWFFHRGLRRYTSGNQFLALR